MILGSNSISKCNTSIPCLFIRRCCRSFFFILLLVLLQSLYSSISDSFVIRIPNLPWRASFNGDSLLWILTYVMVNPIPIFNSLGRYEIVQIVVLVVVVIDDVMNNICWRFHNYLSLLFVDFVVGINNNKWTKLLNTQILMRLRQIRTLHPHHHPCKDRKRSIRSINW